MNSEVLHHSEWRDRLLRKVNERLFVEDVAEQAGLEELEAVLKAKRGCRR